jgi:hypothetical protein
MSIGWNPALNDLIPLLGGLYPSSDSARLAVRRAGLDPDQIDLTGAAKFIWLRIVEEANRHRLVEALIRVAAGDYPNIDFNAFTRQMRQPTLPTVPRLSDDAWKGPRTVAATLEKVTGSQPTFLPIRFLEIGMQRARSVVLVKSPGGLGTGFLAQRRLLITNHHVISTPEEARASKIWFNYQEIESGAEAARAEFTLDPASGFATSPVEGGDDWTAVRIAGDPDEWDPLDLVDATIPVDGFVNIIQHPNGEPKQLALYHNVVAYVDERRVQYLTDTRPGSSGSPVFDSNWRVVALHHSGGWLPEPATNQVYFRNEGIHVRALLRGLRECGLFNQ